MARGPLQDLDRFRRFGWYVGAAFQIQDDILNLTGDFVQHGKEIGGDLWEGKRTLMLIHLLSVCTGAEAQALQTFLAKSRAERTDADVRWIYELMLQHGGRSTSHVVPPASWPERH